MFQRRINSIPGPGVVYKDHQCNRAAPKYIERVKSLVQSSRLGCLKDNTLCDWAMGKGSKIFLERRISYFLITTFVPIGMISYNSSMSSRFSEIQPLVQF